VTAAVLCASVRPFGTWCASVTGRKHISVAMSVSQPIGEVQTSLARAGKGKFSMRVSWTDDRWNSWITRDQ
jgi:hypothetical protein